MNRSADGKFEIVFFEDSRKTKEVSRESGAWWVKADAFYTHTKDVPTPDSYRYEVLNSSAVRFTSLKRDPSGDCAGAYEFTDHKVSAPKVKPAQ